jgi:hypothetical protein
VANHSQITETEKTGAEIDALPGAKLLIGYNIRIGSPPVTRHDRVLPYAFRTA